MNRVIKILFCFSLLFVVGCASIPLASSVGYYGPTPPQGKGKGSYGNAIKNFLVDYDKQDVRKAVTKAAAMNGWTFDMTQDDMLSGVAHLLSPGCAPSCLPDQVFAIYISTIEKRKTSVTIVADQISWCANLCNPQLYLVEKLSATMNSILATYD